MPQQRLLQQLLQLLQMYPLLFQTLLLLRAMLSLRLLLLLRTLLLLHRTLPLPLRAQASKLSLELLLLPSGDSGIERPIGLSGEKAKRHGFKPVAFCFLVLVFSVLAFLFAGHLSSFFKQVASPLQLRRKMPGQCRFRGFAEMAAGFARSGGHRVCRPDGYRKSSARPGPSRHESGAQRLA